MEAGIVANRVPDRICAQLMVGDVPRFRELLLNQSAHACASSASVLFIEAPNKIVRFRRHS